MATLHEYFVKDGAANLTTQQTLGFGDRAGAKLGEFIARLHFDIEAHATYVSFYIPSIEGIECPEALALNAVPQMLKWREEVIVSAGFGEEMKDARELVFTGQVYLYSERPVREAHKGRLLEEAKKIGNHLTFRGGEYVAARDKWQRPLAFISHDSRDKLEIAQPLALGLTNLMCPVWYDEFALKVGDSLRESIERGLKECPKCIFALTPNFLKNGGWAKREYDAVFTRELIEKQRVILPVWHGITKEDVYQYSPVLADRVAVQWSDGVDVVARKLLQSIGA